MRIKAVRYLLLLAVYLMVLSGCRAETPGIVIQKENRETISVSVEVVRTHEARKLGLMYRKALAKNKGMLFVFENEKPHPFTMKNTYIPLDMIFISRTKNIAGIVENTTPKTKGPYSVKASSKYVLEVNAHFCRDNGIKAGDSVIFENIKK